MHKVLSSLTSIVRLIIIIIDEVKALTLGVDAAAVEEQPISHEPFIDMSKLKETFNMQGNNTSKQLQAQANLNCHNGFNHQISNMCKKLEQKIQQMQSLNCISEQYS